MHNKIIIQIDTDMLELVDVYLQRRAAELPVLQTALLAVDFSTLQTVGHQLKGSGPAYGFERYGELGGALERAAETKDAAACKQIISELDGYFASIELQPTSA